MSTIAELVDAAFTKASGITPEVLADIEKTVRDLYPGRSDKTIENLIRRAKDIWIASNPSLSRDMVASFARHYPDETRAVPTAEDIAAFRESEAKRLGVEWDATKRITVFREAQAMTDEQKLAALPADFKTEKADNTTPVNTANAKILDDIDTRIERAFGLQPGSVNSLPVSKVHTYRAELAKMDAAGAPTNTPSAYDVPELGRELTPAERMAQFRRSQGRT